jgi:hypothetical protein
MADNSVAYMAVYDDVDSALADLDALGQLHQDDLIGRYDAAVVDQENGKPHIVKRVDRPRIDVLPELVGRGALPRGDLSDAATELAAGEAALIAVGEPTLEKGFDSAVTRANKVTKKSFDAAADEVADAHRQAARHTVEATPRGPRPMLPHSASADLVGASGSLTPRAARRPPGSPPRPRSTYAKPTAIAAPASGPTT